MAFEWRMSSCWMKWISGFNAMANIHPGLAAITNGNENTVQWAQRLKCRARGVYHYKCQSHLCALQLGLEETNIRWKKQQQNVVYSSALRDAVIYLAFGWVTRSSPLFASFLLLFAVIHSQCSSVGLVQRRFCIRWQNKMEYIQDFPFGSAWIWQLLISTLSAMPFSFLYGI